MRGMPDATASTLPFVSIQMALQPLVKHPRSPLGTIGSQLIDPDSNPSSCTIRQTIHSLTHPAR
jgi:hypothetical protein